jgi:hypothetical protein
MMLPSSGLNYAGEVLRNGLDYVGCMKGRWTVSPVGKGEGGSPVWTTRNSEEGKVLFRATVFWCSTMFYYM